MSALEHLSPEVHAVMSWTTEQRIEYALQDRWIGYTRAQDAIKTLSDLLGYPRTLRMPNLLLVGESGNGKSTIIQRFTELNPVSIQPGGHPVAPVIWMEMPSEPKEGRFWSELLTVLKIAHRPNDKVDALRQQAMSVLDYVQCRMLIVDEIHNILYGSSAQQRQFLGVLKNLSNKLRIPIVTVGTRDAIRTLHTDTQLSSRFEAFGLPKWQLNMEFLRLLTSFERLLPLANPSNLASKELAIKLHNMCSGTIGGLTAVLKRATVQAIRTGNERIDVALLDALGWVKLDDYGKQARSL